MEPKHRALPVGFRFRPTDYEIAVNFLKRKALGEPVKAHIVPEECHDIFSRLPRDLPGYPREEHWYYYCRKLNNNQDSPSVWILIGEETSVLDPKNNDALVGIRRSFTLDDEEESGDICLINEEENEFVKYNWFMDEISLPLTVADTDWVFCHVFGTKIKPEFAEEVEEEEEEDEQEEEHEGEDDEESVVTGSLDLLSEKDVSVLPPSFLIVESESEEGEESDVTENLDLLQEKHGNILPCHSPSPP